MANFCIFVDFWNFQLSLLENTNNKFSADWIKFPPLIQQEVKKLLKPERATYLKTKIYISYNSHSKTDKSLINWMR